MNAPDRYVTFSILGRATWLVASGGQSQDLRQNSGSV
jgi:hypothetical protein